jgi:hypothetical protein
MACVVLVALTRSNVDSVRLNRFCSIYQRGDVLVTHWPDAPLLASNLLVRLRKVGEEATAEHEKSSGPNAAVGVRG